MNISNIDLRLLKVFMAVVQAGGFTQAAERLNIGRSTVSTHMADLEERLAMRLCERGRSGFLLTDRGEQIYESILQLTVALDDFSANVSAIHGHLSGELNIGQIDYMTSVPEYRMSEVLHRFGNEAPKVKINIQILPELEVIRGVLEGRLHLGIVTENNSPDGLQSKPFLSEEILLYCSSRNSLYAREDGHISRSNLIEAPFVGSAASNGSLRQSQLGARVDAHANNLEATLMLILSGHYIGYLPDHFAKAWVASGQLRSLKPDIIRHKEGLPVVTRKGLRKTQQLDKFMSTLFAVHRPELRVPE